MYWGGRGGVLYSQKQTFIFFRFFFKWHFEKRLKFSPCSHFSLSGSFLCCHAHPPSPSSFSSSTDAAWETWDTQRLMMREKSWQWRRLGGDKSGKEGGTEKWSSEKRGGVEEDRQNLLQAIILCKYKFFVRLYVKRGKERVSWKWLAFFNFCC